MIIDFNSNWQFCDNKGTKKIINLPHDAMIEEKRYENCINGNSVHIFLVVNIHTQK